MRMFICFFLLKNKLNKICIKDIQKKSQILPFKMTKILYILLVTVSSFPWIMIIFSQTLNTFLGYPILFSHKICLECLDNLVNYFCTPFILFFLKHPVHFYSTIQNIFSTFKGFLFSLWKISEQNFVYVREGSLLNKYILDE